MIDVSKIHWPEDTDRSYGVGPARGLLLGCLLGTGGWGLIGLLLWGIFR